MNGLFDISGKTALVTGGAQGLGRLLARGLVEAGATVYISSRAAEICNRAASELSATGTCRALTADIASAEGARALVAQYVAHERRLDILVNNAGRTWGAPLESFPDHAWPSVMALNVQSPFTLVKELLPLLRAAATSDDPARVVNVGSVAGSVVEPLQAYSYAASKAALRHLSRVLAAELAPAHVNVNVISPGYFPTRMIAHLHEDETENRRLTARIPAARLGRADDLVGACIYLCSRAGSYLTGAELFVDGGLTGCR